MRSTQTFAIVVHGAGTGLDNVIDIDYGTVTSLGGELVGVGGNSGTGSTRRPPELSATAI